MSLWIMLWDWLMECQHYYWRYCPGNLLFLKAYMVGNFVQPFVDLAFHSGWKSELSYFSSLYQCFVLWICVFNWCDSINIYLLGDHSGASSFNRFIHEHSIDSDTSSSSLDYSSSEEEEEETDETICPPSPLSQSSRVSRARSFSRRNRHWMHWFRYIISWLLFPIKFMLGLPLFIYALSRGSRTSRTSESFQSSHVQARKRLQTLRDQVIQSATDRRRGVVEVWLFI